MKLSLLFTTMAVLTTGQVMACTTILVGNKASNDGSFIIALMKTIRQLMPNIWLSTRP